MTYTLKKLYLRWSFRVFFLKGTEIVPLGCYCMLPLGVPNSGPRGTVLPPLFLSVVFMFVTDSVVF